MSIKDKEAKKDWLLQILRGAGVALVVSTVFTLPPAKAATDNTETGKSLSSRISAARLKLQNSDRSGFTDPFSKDAFDKAFDKFTKEAHNKDPWEKTKIA